MELVAPFALMAATWVVAEFSRAMPDDENEATSEGFTTQSTEQKQPQQKQPQQKQPRQTKRNQPEDEVDSIEFWNGGAEDHMGFAPDSSAVNMHVRQTKLQNAIRGGRDASEQVASLYDFPHDPDDLYSRGNRTIELPYASSIAHRKPSGPSSAFGDQADAMLDFRAGLGTLHSQKEERGPLTGPSSNLHYPNGMPSTSDFMQERVYVSQKNHAEPPQPIHVAPGLDGANTMTRNGFNAAMDRRDLWMPKTVDELRVATNPKDEYSFTGLEGAPASRVKSRGVQGIMQKNHPDTAYRNDPSKWLVTTGDYTKPMAHGKSIVDPTHRDETSCPVIGPASASLKTAGYQASAHSAPTRSDMTCIKDHIGPADAQGHAPGAREGAVRQEGYVDSNTHRDDIAQKCGSAPTLLSGFRAAVGAAIAPITDILAPTRRADIACAARLGSTGIQNQGHYVSTNPYAPEPTTRETTEYSSWGFMSTQNNVAGSYVGTTPNVLAQNREDCGESRVLGASSARGYMDYTPAYDQAPGDRKEGTLVNRTPNGGTALLNHHIHANNLREPIQYSHLNGAVFAQQSNSRQIPETTRLTAETPAIGLERIDGSIMGPREQNPYAIQI